jgi:hypothetical protein
MGVTGFAGAVILVDIAISNLRVIATNLAALRNPYLYGSGHWNSAAYRGLEERHAKLAVGSRAYHLPAFFWILMRGWAFETMNRISEITKRDILDLFKNGIDIPDLWETQRVTYNYFGRLEETEFLKRLYDLKSMPSLDSRFQDAESDIWQHTVNNDDYLFCWVFEDERFQLKDGSDEVYLKFICEIFHPTVRLERYWKEFFTEINKSQREILEAFGLDPNTL